MATTTTSEPTTPKLKDVNVVGRKQADPNTDYRIIIFGAAGVGKSSLALRFVRGTFKESYVPTIEDTYKHVITSNKQVYTLSITDTTGSHQFPAMQRLNIQKGHAFILVYSITSLSSLEELRAVYKEIVEIKCGQENKIIPMMLVGNKCDETTIRAVTTHTGDSIAEQMNCAFIETSAKTNTNIKEAFQELLKLDPKNSNLIIDDSGADNVKADKSNGKSSKKKESGGKKKKCTIM